MEISPEQIKTSFDVFKKHEMTSALQEIYSAIPGGTCNGCASCCTESVQAFYVEFLSILDYLEKNKIDYKERIESHYFNELIQNQNCPFLDERKQCMIYPVRPLVCRLFGYRTREEHDGNYDLIAEDNDAADQYFFETYKVHIPEEVRRYKIKFCEDFLPGRTINRQERQNLADRMFMLDSQFLMEDLIPDDAFEMSITNWFIYMTYSEEEASKKRIDRLLDIYK